MRGGKELENLKYKINEAVWDGKDENGNRVSVGVYFLLSEYLTILICDILMPL